MTDPAPRPAPARAPACALRAGFTFVEVLACLLVVGLGLASVVAMVYFGIVNAQKAMTGSTAMITAMTVAVDAQPYVSPDVAGTWSGQNYSFDNTSATQSVTAQGWINGYLVVRNEVTGPGDLIAVDTSPVNGNTVVYARSVLVKVDVYGLLNGAIVASYNTRFVRQRTTP